MERFPIKQKKVIYSLLQIKLVFAALLLLFTVDYIFTEIFGGDYYEKNLILLSILIITTIYIITGFIVWFRSKVQLFSIHRIIPALLAYFTYSLFKITHADQMPEVVPLLNILTVILIGLFFTSIVLFIETLIKSDSRSRKKYLLYFGIAFVLMAIDTFTRIFEFIKTKF